jgi:uncharacterized radical SAM superfamily Fe-S cluster-containing enzyme
MVLSAWQQVFLNPQKIQKNNDHIFVKNALQVKIPMVYCKYDDTNQWGSKRNKAEMVVRSDKESDH